MGLFRFFSFITRKGRTEALPRVSCVVTQSNSWTDIMCVMLGSRLCLEFQIHKTNQGFSSVPSNVELVAGETMQVFAPRPRGQTLCIPDVHHMPYAPNHTNWYKACARKQRISMAMSVVLSSTSFQIVSFVSANSFSGRGQQQILTQ